MEYFFTALCFGLNVGPRVFTKCLKKVIQFFRRELMVWISFYLDDLLAQVTDPQRLARKAEVMIIILQLLGFRVNIRCILNQTGTLIIPGKTGQGSLSEYNVYNIPSGEEWRVPLLKSLIEIREKRWEVQFSEEGDETLNDDAIKLMIDRACGD